MTHSLRISVSKDAGAKRLVKCRKIAMREKVLAFLFGGKQRLTILIPGDSVESLSINEIKEGGQANEQN